MTKTQISKIEELGQNSQFKEQAEYFLECAGVRFEAVKAVPQDAPEWATNGQHGIKYSVTLSKIKEGAGVVNQYTKQENQPQLFSEVICFPFWGSIYDKEKASRSISGYSRPKPYDVLAGLDSMYNDTFEDWCMNYGYDDDSRDAYKTYQRCQELDIKLKKVFTPDEMDALQYIN